MHEREKVETYLSVKYGLSIIGEYNYLSSAGDTIWDIKKNNNFNYRITGIGRDDALNLYQKQSGNSEKDGLYIGFGKIDTINALNKYKLKNNTFLLWGDNGKTTVINDTKDGTPVAMKRNWKMQLSGKTAGDTLTTQLKLNKKEMNLPFPAKGEVFWLVINDLVSSTFESPTARYIKQSREDEEHIYFDAVNWDPDADGADMFTIAKGVGFFAQVTTAAECSRTVPGVITTTVAGGTAPYRVTITSAKGYKTTQDSETGNISTADVPLGEYTVAVKDAIGTSWTKNITVDVLGDVKMGLNTEWYLDESGKVTVLPAITTGTTDKFIYSWLKVETVVASGPTAVFSEKGNYTLIVANVAGCKKVYPFTVHEAMPEWAVYPNPVKKSEPFHTKFNLPKEANVSIAIHSIDGKLYLSKELTGIKEYTFDYSLLSAGVYTITTIIEGKMQSINLIVID